MSHLHVPDGIISLWLWILGYLIVGIYFLIVYKHLKRTEDHKKIAIVGVLGALMLLSMSIPLPFIIPYHLNLSALLGILAGPFYAGLAIFSVNSILALIGHGGITMVGLNTIVVTIEAIVAFLLFNLLRKHFRQIFPAAFIATLIALITSTFLTIGIVYTGTKNLKYLTHKCSHHHNHTISQEHQQQHERNDSEPFNIKRFIFLILISGSLGWMLEAFITAFIATYISRVKPDLFEDKEFSVKITDIDYYAVYGNSFLNKLSAKIKLLVAFLVITTVVFSYNIFVLSGLYLILIGIIGFSSVPKRKIIKLSLFPLVFLVLFLVSIHDLSWELAFIFIFKALSASSVLVLLVFTTSYVDIFKNISRFMPNFAVNMLFMTYRSIFILMKTFENLMNMLKFRGNTSVKRPVLFLKNIGNLVGFFVIKSVQTGENLYEAMKLRGYSNNFDYLRKK